MRTTLFWTLSLLAALPAQQPERGAATPPPRADVTDAKLAAAARMHAQAGQLPAKVHFDQPRADAPLWAVGTAWKAAFDDRGTTVIPFFGSDAPQNFPLRVELQRATVGGESLALPAGKPTHTGNQVRTDRGALIEVIDTAPQQLEQTFVFDRLPTRGELVVEVGIDGPFEPTLIDGGVRFANAFGHVDYVKALAIDAAGRELPLAIDWTGSAARIVIPAEFVAEAALPLRLDPTLLFWYQLGSGQTLLQHDPDVASYGTGNGRTLLVWQRQWSLTDQDCWGLMFDSDLGLVLTDFPIDFTGEDWLKISVAGNDYAQNFLVVSEVRIGLLWFIAGRLIAPNGTVGAQFDIEREGVVGTAGNNFHPDVGSDPYFGVGRYTVVFNKRTAFTSDIYLRQITTAGGMVTTNAVQLDTTSRELSRPAISKSCGQSNGLPAHWAVVWQAKWNGAPFDEDVQGIFVNWNGTVIGTPFTVIGNFDDETAPAPSSPIDIAGERLWPICFATAIAAGQPRDVRCQLHRVDGSLRAAFTVSNNVPNADDHEPEVDSDGTRFVTMLTSTVPGAQPQIEAVTTAFLAATDTFRVEERTGLSISSASSYGQPNVCAAFSGTSQATPRYYLAFTEQSTNTLRLASFVGHAGGLTYFTTRPTQCGSLPISVTGSPAIGQSMTFTVGGTLSGTIFGFPDWIPLNVLGCNCVQGVGSGFYGSNPATWTVPNDPVYVGITLSVQGFTLAGSQCLGVLDLSDTIDFTLR